MVFVCFLPDYDPWEPPGSQLAKEFLPNQPEAGPGAGFQPQPPENNAQCNIFRIGRIGKSPAP